MKKALIFSVKIKVSPMRNCFFSKDIFWKRKALLNKLIYTRGLTE